MRRAKRSPTLLRALAEQMHFLVAPGVEWRGEVRDDDIVAEVSVRVRRYVSHDAARAYREGALDVLRMVPARVGHCGCSVQRRTGWGTHRGDCSGRIVAAVVYRSFGFHQETDVAHQFVCSRHREAHDIRRDIVLAVVDIPEALIRPIREQRKKNAAAWSRRCRAEDEEREGAPVGHVVAWYELVARTPAP